MNIEFIIPTWDRPEQLKVILQSLIVQTNPNWIAHVIIDGLTNEYRQVKDLYQEEERVRFSHVEGPHNDWGHTARNYGLDKRIGDFIVMTGDDNYYVPTFVENFLSQPQYDLIYCDMVHDLKRNAYLAIKTELSLGRIDIGNVMFRSSIIGDIRLNTKSYEADWWFINSIMIDKTSNIRKIDKVLYVHN